MINKRVEQCSSQTIYGFAALFYGAVRVGLRRSNRSIVVISLLSKLFLRWLFCVGNPPDWISCLIFWLVRVKNYPLPGELPYKIIVRKSSVTVLYKGIGILANRSLYKSICLMGIVMLMRSIIILILIWGVLMDIILQGGWVLWLLMWPPQRRRIGGVWFFYHDW